MYFEPAWSLASLVNFSYRRCALASLAGSTANFHAKNSQAKNL